MIIEKNNLKYLRKNLGESLWSLRQKHNYTLAYLSKQTGLSPKRLEKIELGRGVPLNLCLKLFDFYNKKINIETID